MCETLVANARTNREEPIPVILNVSSWISQEEVGSREQFIDWFKQAFHRQYKRGGDRGEAWLDNDKLLLILDGLDQIPPQRRRTFVESVNDYYDDGWSDIIIACRDDVYLKMSQKIDAPNTIELLCLDDGLSDLEYRQRVKEYIDHLGHTGLVQEVFDSFFEATENMRHLLNTPLMVRLMMDVCVEEAGVVFETAAHEGVEEVKWLLSEACASSRFEKAEEAAERDKRGRAYPTVDARRWLAQLARNMEAGRFYIEQMQLDWLSADKHVSYRVWMTFITTLLFVPIGILYGLSLSAPASVSLAQGLAGGLAFALTLGFGAGIAYFFVPGRWLAELITTLAAFLAVMGMFWFAWGMIDPRYALALAVGVFIVVRASGILKNKEQILVESFSLTWKKALIRAGAVLGVGLLIGILLDRLLSGLFEMVAFVMLFLALFVFAIGLKHEADWGDIESPNEGVHRALRNALIISAAVTLLSWFMVLLIASADYVFLDGIYDDFRLWDGGPLVVGPLATLGDVALGGYMDALAVAVTVGIVTFLLNGGLDVLRHYVLRLMLQRETSIPDGSYSDFLDYADYRLNLLLCMGGGYEFIPDFGGYFEKVGWEDGMEAAIER